MIRIEAPWPLVKTVTILPSPELQDTESLTDNLVLHKSMNGTRYTYVNKNTNRRYKFAVQMTRKKALEFFEFYRCYSADKWRLTTLYDGKEIIGNITTNPLELRDLSHSTYAVGTDQESEERGFLDFEFEGIEQ